MIKQAVKDFANTHGFDFYVSGLGYRGTAQITTLGDKPQSVSRCNNNSKDALQAINALIAQRKLDTKSDDAIATEAEQAISDLLPPVVAICDVEADQAYQELLPVVDHERIAKQGELTADDFRSTYTPRDTFGDDAFVFSARYGEMALI